MTQQEIIVAYNTICRGLEQKQLKETLDKMAFLAQSSNNWQLSEEVAAQKETYQQLLNYSISDVQDPQQKKIYATLQANCYKLADSIKEVLLTIYSSNFVYSQKRYFDHLQINITQLLAELESTSSHSSLSRLLEESLQTSGKRKEYAQQHEELSNRLFMYLWLSAAKGVEDFRLVMDNEYLSSIEKSLCVSALTLSLLRYFDEERLLLLVDLCEHADLQLAQRALVGLLPVLAKYNERLPLFTHIRNRLVIFFDDGGNRQRIKKIIMQYIRSTETEQLTRKMQEEILPEMMKMAPLLKEQMEHDTQAARNSDDPDDLNPEWQEKLEESGIAEKLREVTELQMEGSDVYMSTFAMLKNFPFFNETSNWFRPFEFSQADISELFAETDNSFIAAMMNNSQMCNSDRYSFCFSMLKMSEKERKMLSAAFAAEAEQLKEIENEENILRKNLQAEQTSNAYIQDLYRFFNLFQYRRDFDSPFAYALDFHNTWFFSLIAFNAEDIREITEYYFAKKCYKQALQLFENLQRDTETLIDICQKMGYCHQQLGNIDAALGDYLKAEIIEPDNGWTIRKIAYCYRLQGNYEKALEYYLHAEQLQPDNHNLTVQAGNCYLQLQQYDKAIACYFKVEFSSTDNVKMWRAIAWASFLAGKLPQAEKFYRQAIEQQLIWTDYLNLAHVLWALGNKQQAIENYKLSIATNANNMDDFINHFALGNRYLVEKGIDPEDIALVLDYLRYFAQTNKFNQ
ncbi:MAG: tetratricopeptide repeat protein [Prevotellaceae bacterium]|nr:tetratricopeptide repeat protein [Prevotellaceae bacterium]